MKNLTLPAILLFLLVALSTVPAVAETGEPHRPGEVAEALVPSQDACYGNPPFHETAACWAPFALAAQAEVGDTATSAPVESGGGEAPPAALSGWKWRRMNGWEYAGIGVAAAATLYLEYDEGDPKTAGWGARNDFDEAVRNVLRLGGISERRAVNRASDAIMGLMIAAPALDSFYTLGYRDRDYDALYQTLMIDVESFTFTSFVSVILQTQLARERPFVRNGTNGSFESDEIFRGMPSGHTAYAFTGAGLLCTHHKYQHNYNDPALEGTVCATALGVASIEGVLRIMADGHYASDVLAGAAIGLFSGFLLPRLLHYWKPQPAPEQKTRHEPQKEFFVAPTVLQGTAPGLACRYNF